MARHIYARASANGKRVQAQGGAKNPLIILPDADVSLTTRIVTDSAFGNAGQRCLAASLAVTVAGAEQTFVPALAEAAGSLVVGNGLQQGVQMGPVITPQSKARIEGLIQKGLDEGAEMVLDGRHPGMGDGYFLKPTIISDVAVGSTIAKTEIFGPVLGVMRVATVEDAIALVNGGEYGNMACVFTGTTRALACGSVVLVTARNPLDELYHALAGDGFAVSRAGDCYGPGTIAAAVHSGRRFAEEFGDPPRDHLDLPFRREVIALDQS